MVRSDDPSAHSLHDAAAALLTSLPAERLGVYEGVELQLAAPIARYRITAKMLARDSFEAAAYQWGWRYFLVLEGHLLPLAIDVRPGRDAGSWRAGLVSGPHLGRQLALIAALAQDDALAGTVRILDAPGLDWSGFWVTGEDHLLVTLKSGRRLDNAKLMQRLRRTALRQRRALDMRSRHPTSRRAHSTGGN